MPNHPHILQVLADNETLMEVVKKAVLDQFNEMPYSEGASDEFLGQIARARFVGRQKVEAAFELIAGYKSQPKPVDNSDSAY